MRNEYKLYLSGDIITMYMSPSFNWNLVGPGWYGSLDSMPACEPASLIPSQGSCLGCGIGPQLGMCESNHTWMFRSLSFSLSPLSKNK